MHEKCKLNVTKTIYCWSVQIGLFKQSALHTCFLFWFKTSRVARTCHTELHDLPCRSRTYSQLSALKSRHSLRVFQFGNFSAVSYVASCIIHDGCAGKCQANIKPLRRRASVGWHSIHLENRSCLRRSLHVWLQKTGKNAPGRWRLRECTRNRPVGGRSHFPGLRSRNFQQPLKHLGRGGIDKRIFMRT